MKKVILLLSLFLLSISLLASPAEAHILASDNNIGAILHVDPNDEPIAGQQSGFFFEFKDKQGKFTPQNCDCTFIVIENGNTIYSQPLFQSNNKPSLSNASAFYTFPKGDVYQVEVIGKPLTPNAFQPFKLVWNWRVDQETNSQITTAKNSSNVVIDLIHTYLILLEISAVVFVILFIAIGQKYKKPTLKASYEKSSNENRKQSG